MTDNSSTGQGEEHLLVVITMSLSFKLHTLSWSSRLCLASRITNGTFTVSALRTGGFETLHVALQRGNIHLLS